MSKTSLLDLTARHQGVLKNGYPTVKCEYTSSYLTLGFRDRMCNDTLL